jgi:hypothetical protein
MNVLNTTNGTTPTVLSSIVPLLQSILKGVNLYGAFCILIPGVILNVITLLVFLRKRFWTRTTMGFFYSVSSGLSAGLGFIGIIAFLPAGYGNDWQLLSSGLCGLIWQIRVFFGFASCYFKILITVNLTLSTVYINKFPALQKIKNLAIITAVMFSLLIISNSVHWLRFLKYTPVLQTNTTTTYTVTCVLASDIQTVYLFEGILSRYVPAGLNFIMNFIIIRALVKSKRSTNTDHKISSKEVNFAVSLIAINFMFVLSILPYTVLAALQIRNVFVNPAADYVNTVNSLYSFGIWLTYIYESSDFFMNLGFNKLFRSELRVILDQRSGTTGNTQSQGASTVATSRIHRLTQAKINTL